MKLEELIKGINVTHFYSSEEYGKYVAKYLGIENVVVDKERKIFDVSASNIRKDIEKYKMFLNEDVYMDMKENRRE